MRPRVGMTLVELQIASIIMGIILVSLGVIMVTALNAVRILNDAHVVYWNALAAMRSLQLEISRSNRYGWFDVPTTYTPPFPSVYGLGGVEGSEIPTRRLPSLEGITQDAEELWLRADAQPRLGESGSDPKQHGDDVIIHFYRNDENSTLVQNVEGVPRTVASHVSQIGFSRVAYNAVAVKVIVQGDLMVPYGGGGTGPKHEAVISTVVNLRGAALNAAESRSLDEGYAGAGLW